MLLLACCRFPTSSLNVHYDEKRSWICCFGPGSARLLRWWAKKASFTSRREGWSRAARLPRRSSGTAHRCNPDIYIPCLLITSCKKATTVNMIDTRIQITLQTLLPKLANVSVADSAALLAGGRRTGFPSLIWDLMARARMASATPSWQLSVARRIGFGRRQRKIETAQVRRHTCRERAHPDLSGATLSHAAYTDTHWVPKRIWHGSTEIQMRPRLRTVRMMPLIGNYFNNRGDFQCLDQRGAIHLDQRAGRPCVRLSSGGIGIDEHHALRQSLGATGKGKAPRYW